MEAISAALPPAPRKVIQVQVWRLQGSAYFLRSYTATWCKPCGRIKPYIFDLVQRGTLVLLETRELKTGEAPMGMLIPFFELFDNDGVKLSIQTSDSDELEHVLKGFSNVNT